MPGRWSRARCCWKTSGIIISTRRRTLSTCISRGCVPRSTRGFPSRCCIPCAARDTWSVTALGKLFRTTTFQLSLVYLTVFALFAAFLLGYFAWNTRRLFTEQINATIEAEVNGLADQYRSGGIRQLVQAIESRS